MPRYLLLVMRPRGYDPAAEPAELRANISDLNREMIAAGVRVFAGGLEDPGKALSLPVAAAARPSATADMHIGGLWILDLSGPEAAADWAGRAARACRATIELRAFH